MTHAYPTRLSSDLDGVVVVEQVVHHALVAARRGGDAGAAVGTGELDRALVAGDVHFLDPVATDVGDELRVDDLVAAARGFRTEALEHHHQHDRSEEHTSELQSLMRISYAVFCLKKKNNTIRQYTT